MSWFDVGADVTATVREGARRLAADLRAAGYTVDGVEDFLGPLASAALHREEIVPARMVLERRRGEPLACIIRALMLGEQVPPAEFDAALPNSGVGALRELGIWRDDRCQVELRPFDTGHVVSDFGEMVTGRQLPDDYVLGVGGATRTLADAIIPGPLGRVLDLGTGCGALALQLAPQAQQVVATDISHRALALSRNTFDLNDVSVELRLGSLFEPVAGERFDLIVSNPPFVITPRVAGVPQYEYRDGGMVGDGLVRSVVAQVGEYLNPGGVAQLLGNWEVPTGAVWEDVVARWIPAELDAWVMQREALDPAQYAEMWLRDAGLPENHAELYRAWLDDFAARDVASIGFGLITLRQPHGVERLRRFEDVSGTAHPPTGAAIALGLNAAQVGPESVLKVAPDVTQEHYYRPGEADPTVVQLRQGGLLGRTIRVGSATAGVVGACDGTIPLGVLVGAVAQVLESDETQTWAEVGPMITELVFTGFLQQL